MQVRRQIRIKMGMLHYKSVHAVGRGNAAVTRTQGIVDTVTERQDRQASRYRAARAALVVLSPDGEWKKRLLELHSDDMRTPADEELAAEKARRMAAREKDAAGLRRAALGEGSKQVPWIWRTLKHDARDMPNVDGVATDADAHQGKPVF